MISEKSEAGQWVMDGDGVSHDSLVLILLDWFKMVYGDLYNQCLPGLPFVFVGKNM